MRPDEAFKAGFLIRCAEERLSPDQIQERVEKSAGVLMDALKGLWNTGTGLASSASTAALLAPLAVGVGGGYGLAKMQDEPVDYDEIKKTEQLAEYRRAIEQLARARKAAK